MKKLKFLGVLVAVAAVFLLLGLAVSCGGEQGSDAKLISFKVRGIEAEKIPIAITGAQWKSDDQMFDLEIDPDYRANVVLGPTSDRDDADLAFKVSDGAKVTFGKWAGARPVDFVSDKIISLTTNQSVVVKVVSEDGSKTNYYRFFFVTQSNDAAITEFLVAGIAATELGAGGAAYGDAATGKLLIPRSKSQNADISIMTRSNTAQMVKYRIQTGASNPTSGLLELTRGTNAGGRTIFTGKANFEHGQRVYLQVTSEDGTILWFRADAQVGNDATLRLVSIGDDVAELGTPKAFVTSGTGTNIANWSTQPDFTASQKGVLQPDQIKVNNAFVVVIEATDEEAKIEWMVDLPTSKYGPDRINLDDLVVYTNDGSPATFTQSVGDILIKVTSANEASIRIYRIGLVSKNFISIARGTPSTVATGTIAPEWDAVPAIVIDRFNRGESWLAYWEIEGNAHTEVKVKLLWDDDGLWSYWDVDYKDYYDTQANFDSKTGAITRQTKKTTDGTTDSNAHEHDSVELFINETYQMPRVSGSAEWGNQFRCAADGGWLSGRFSAGETNDNQAVSTKFKAEFGKTTNAWIKDNDKGYVVILHGFWTEKEYADADQLFGTDGKVKVGARIGLEMQVNACSVKEGVRDAILTWNGIASQAYQNVRNYGVAELVETLPAN